MKCYTICRWFFQPQHKLCWTKTSLSTINRTQTLVSLQIRTCLHGIPNCENTMDTGWTVCITHKYPQERACSLMGPSAIRLLISFICLTQKVIAFLNLWFLPQTSLGWTHHRDSELPAYSWQIGLLSSFGGCLLLLSIDYFVWLSGLLAACNSSLPSVSPGILTSVKHIGLLKPTLNFFL